MIACAFPDLQYNIFKIRLHYDSKKCYTREVISSRSDFIIFKYQECNVQHISNQRFLVHTKFLILVGPSQSKIFTKSSFETVIKHPSIIRNNFKSQLTLYAIRHACALLKDQIKATFLCNNPTRRATTFCRMSIGFMFTCTFKHFELWGCSRDLSTLAFRDEKMHYNKYLPVLRTFCCGLIDCDKYQRKCHRIGTRIWGLLFKYTHFIFLRY